MYFVRIGILHTNHKATTSLIAKCGHIAKDTTSSITWLCLGSPVICKVPLLGFLEFYLVFRLFEFY